MAKYHNYITSMIFKVMGLNWLDGFIINGFIFGQWIGDQHCSNVSISIVGTLGVLTDARDSIKNKSYLVASTYFYALTFKT